MTAFSPCCGAHIERQYVGLDRFADVCVKCDKEVEADAVPTLRRDRKHDHFWIDDGELYESYRTIRGLRYRHHLSVPGLPDMDAVPEAVIKEIEARFRPALPQAEDANA